LIKASITGAFFIHKTDPADPGKRLEGGKIMEGTVATAEQETQERTFNQEEVNQIVQERLFKERKKYEGIDIDALKEKASKFDQMEEANKTELQKANEKASALEAELNAMKAANEVREIRMNVSKATNVPFELLTGSTEEECKAQAEAIKAYANPSYPTVRDGGEVANTGKATTRDQFAQYVSQVI
jgi:hypothetical protein